MELLVVIALLVLGGILVKFHFDRVEERNKRTEAQSDLKQIAEAVDELYGDTNIDPGHVSRNPCVRYPEMFLRDCRAGLLCTDGAFPNWNGPYLEDLPKDPWGGRYYFNADYLCVEEALGCEEVPNTTKVRAILSGGPDGNFKTRSNNIVHIICK